MNTSVECVVCEKLESNANNILTCLYCFSNAHPFCRNITGKAFKRIKSKMYFCTVRCSENFERINKMLNNKTFNLSTISEEMKSIVSSIVISQLNVMNSEVKSVSSAIEKSQNFMSSKFDDILEGYKQLKKENETLKQHISIMEKSISALESTVNDMEEEINKSELKEISNNAIILGIPFTKNENLTDIVCKTASHIGVNLNPESLVSATRVKTNHKVNATGPIRLVFKRLCDKELLFAKKKFFGTVKTAQIIQKPDPNNTNVIIRDELTPLALNLLNKIRELQSKYKIRYVWPGRNGAILVKEDYESIPILIKTKNDFNLLVNKLSSASCISS